MKKLSVLMFLCFATFSAQAADEKPSKIDWKACDKEIKEFSCKGTDKQIWECLEKHDADLSKTCDKTHEIGDELFEKK